MTMFEDLIMSYGKMPRRVAYNNLRQLGNQLFGNNWKFVNKTGSNTDTDRKEKTYAVEITEKWLTIGCDKTECNRAGYVLAVEHMWHEYRHIHQNMVEWNSMQYKGSPEAEQMTDIIRRYMVESVLAPVYAYNYVVSPGEMDAEAYGTKHAVEYLMNGQKLIPKEEAVQMLVDIMASEEYGHRPELRGYRIETADDLVASFEDLVDACIHRRYLLEPREDGRNLEVRKTDTDITDRFLNDPEFESFRNAFEDCTDGKEMDKVMEQVFVYLYPDIEQAVPRLSHELRDCRRQMKWRSLTLRPGAIPAEEIRYTGNMTNNMTDNEPIVMNLLDDDSDFTDAVNNIKNNNGGITL